MKLSKIPLGLMISLLVSFSSVSSQNIIPNPGFEVYSTCPGLFAQLSYATGWSYPAVHGGTADFFNSCDPGPWAGVPVNFAGSQLAHSGDGYVGIVTYDQSIPNFREYFEAQLDSTLQPGVTYVVSAWVSLADRCAYASDELHFLFGATPPIGSGTLEALSTYTPTAMNLPGNFLTDKINWVQVSGVFTATGGEQFITVGNFYDDASTSLQFLGTTSNFLSYLYIDDLNLRRDVITNAEMLPLTARERQGEVVLNWTTLTESGTSRFEVERSVDDLRSWEKVGSVPASGDSDQELHYHFVDYGARVGQPNYYRLHLLDLNGEAHFSNAVAVSPDAEEEGLTEIYPNPLNSGQAIHADLHLGVAEQVWMDISDLRGKTILQASRKGEIGENRFEFGLDDIARGTYLMRVRTASFSTVERIVVR